ncbi:hypothetical protein ABPG74_009402 [Tetrahymena malaccensis]
MKVREERGEQLLSKANPDLPILIFDFGNLFNKEAKYSFQSTFLLIKDSSIAINQGNILYVSNDNKQQNLYIDFIKISDAQNTATAEFNNINSFIYQESMYSYQVRIIYIQEIKNIKLSNTRIIIDYSNQKCLTYHYKPAILFLTALNIQGNFQLRDIEVYIESKQSQLLNSQFLYLSIFYINSQSLVVANFNLSIKNTFQEILVIEQVQDVQLFNFTLTDTSVSQLQNFNLKNSFINFNQCDKILIENITISKVYVQNFQFLNFQEDNEIQIQNVYFGFFEQQLHQIEDSLYEKEHTQNAWEGPLIYFYSVNTVLVQNFNINETEIKGDQSLLNFESIQTEEQFQSKVTLENFNIILNSGYNYLHGSILQLINLQIINLNQINIKIVSNQNNINLNKRALFIMLSDGEDQLSINEFYVEVLNIDKNPNFLINSLGGSIFLIQGYESQTFANKITAKNVRSLSSGGFGQFYQSSIQIQNSFFENLSSKINGGALDLIIKKRLIVQETQFIKCQSDLFGGAINIQIFQKNKIDYHFYQVQIKECSSLIGGGIIGPGMMQNSEGISFFNNSVSIFGKDYCNPVSDWKIIKILQYNEEFQDESIRDINIPFKEQYQYKRLFPKKQITIEQAQSMQAYYIGLQFYIDDKPVQIPSNFTDLQKLSLSSYLNGQFYNFLDFLNLRNKDSTFYFMIKTPIFQQQFVSLFKESKEPIEIVFIQSDVCQEGQILQDGICVFCGQNTVTERGSTVIQDKCLECQDTLKIKDCYAYKSFLNPGYIRYKNYTVNTNLIQKCSYSPSNCQGGEYFGNQSCSPSYIGPECLECDFNYTRNNSFNCYKCGISK